MRGTRRARRGAKAKGRESLDVDTEKVPRPLAPDLDALLLTTTPPWLFRGGLLCPEAGAVLKRFLMQAPGEVGVTESRRKERRRAAKRIAELEKLVAKLTKNDKSVKTESSWEEQEEEEGEEGPAQVPPLSLVPI